MLRRELQRTMYELKDASMPQRLSLALMVGALVLFSWWLLLGGGLAAWQSRFPWLGQGGDAGRRLALAAGFAIYFVRILFTEFVFLRRGVAWSEVFTIVPWLAFIFALLAVTGGGNAARLGAAAAVGGVLFAVGSWMNSYAEYARHRWKQRPENAGRLYTEGLFRYSRHPNYLGDMLSFSGLCLIAGHWLTAIVPLLMLAGFVFVNIPILDSHLHDHYGSDFDEYARRTRKLIPYLY